MRAIIVVSRANPVIGVVRDAGTGIPFTI